MNGLRTVPRSLETIKEYGHFGLFGFKTIWFGPISSHLSLPLLISISDPVLVSISLFLRLVCFLSLASGNSFYAYKTFPVIPLIT